MIKLMELVKELSYTGNVGIMELVKFFEDASPSEVRTFSQLMKAGKHDTAMKLVQKVTGTQLKGM